MNTIHNKIYKKLEQLGILEIEEYAKFKSRGLMDLSVDRLDTDRFALAHNGECNGDLMADPDMVVRVYADHKMAEALTFQNDYIGAYQTVYDEQDGKQYVNLKLKKELNTFLNNWLENLLEYEYQKQ